MIEYEDFKRIIRRGLKTGEIQPVGGYEFNEVDYAVTWAIGALREQGYNVVTSDQVTRYILQELGPWIFENKGGDK